MRAKRDTMVKINTQCEGENIMDQNVVSFQEKAEHRYEALQQKVMRGIDSKELYAYYDQVVKDRIEHLAFIQRDIAEEFLGEAVIDSFTMGVEASKLRLVNKRIDLIEEVYFQDLKDLLADLLINYKLVKSHSEEDVALLSKMAKELGRDWFRKGVFYGERQRKLRLI